MNPLRTLEAYARAPRSRPPESERCELCGAEIPPRHRHLVDLERRALCCGCQPCSLLFMQRGAAGGRYRTIPDRVLVDPSFELTERSWSTLQIPVRLAFVFFNSKQGRWIALYPSPVGSTEAEIPGEAWSALAEGCPLVREIEPDVEALLVWGPRERKGFECYLAPIDACYELVARIRRNWSGFDGGDSVRKEIADFFVHLRTRSRSLRKTSPGVNP